MPLHPEPLHETTHRLVFEADAFCLRAHGVPCTSWENAPSFARRVSAEVVWLCTTATGGEDLFQAHERWLDTLREDGWTYGERLDERAKEHPFLRTFPELPPREQARLRLMWDMATFALQRLALSLPGT